MRKGVPDRQIKALAMAFAGAVLAAVATMFVPVTMLEAFTGATGLSELVPAAAAPLGDTARALIAFAAGALTLSVLAYLLLRHESPPRAEPEAGSDDEVEEAASFKHRLARIALPKMPWTKGEDDITDLSDLPKLRNGDAHPDAPPRRPLSAHHDLPELDLAEVAIARPDAKVAVRTEKDQTEILMSAENDAPKASSILVEPAADLPTMATEAIEPTLAEMVAQLEAAVAERQSQLAELEAVAAQLGAGRVMQQAPFVAVDVEPEQAPKPTPEPMIRRSLEAVPASVKDDDIDSALAAALATLHRMNGTSR